MQYDRVLRKELQARTSRGKVRLILGARQTGKSTLFRMLEGPDSILFDLQDRSERSRLARDPQAFTRRLAAAPNSVRHVLVDEIQRVPELLDEIQLLVDRSPGRFAFTVSGSSARRLRRADVNLLPGRIHRHFLGPVCLWEWDGARESRVLSREGRRTGTAFPPRSLEQLLTLGSLPGAYVEGAEFEKTIESYGEIYVEEEVLREAAARNLGQYGRFLELAAVESGKILNLTKLSNETGIPLSTVRGFYSVLEDTLVGFSVPPFARSGRARTIKTPKFYLFDVGVRNALARLPMDPRILHTEGPGLLEHWVACELYVRTRYVGREARLGFWRTVDGVEVDFILETFQETIPIEVKYTERPRPVDAAGVEAFLSRYPEIARQGFVVCRCRTPEQLTPRVLAIPWESL